MADHDTINQVANVGRRGVGREALTHSLSDELFDINSWNAQQRGSFTLVTLLSRLGHVDAEGAPVDTLLRVDESAVNFVEYFRKYGAVETHETPCAPRVTYGGGRGELKSRIRSAMSPWLDRREPLDVIRDRLEERAEFAI